MPDRDLRVRKHIHRGPSVRIIVEGQDVEAFVGETLAAALMAAGYRSWRTSPRAGEPRSLFCGMGVCQECVVRADGRLVTACTEAVRDGMQVELGGSTQ